MSVRVNAHSVPAYKEGQLRGSTGGTSPRQRALSMYVVGVAFAVLVVPLLFPAAHSLRLPLNRIRASEYKAYMSMKQLATGSAYVVLELAADRSEA